jgi:hypothetical protein
LSICVRQRPFDDRAWEIALNDRRAGIMSFVGPNTCVGNFESIEITPDLSLDPSPEITGGN